VREPRDRDAYSFHTWNKEKLQNDPRALNLIKDMLRVENSFRLGEEYQVEYKKSQDDTHKTKVTIDIQNRVVNQFMPQAVGIYSNLDEGINFLRAAVGNFGEDHLQELMDCANYVKYTQVCVRGPLRLGDKVDLSTIPLHHPETFKEELLSDWLHPDKPLVILASSYT
jgi:RNA processing factor Prp31